MKSLESLRDLINNIATSDTILNKVKELFPVHKFELATKDYINFVEELRNSGDYDLIDYVFDKSGIYKTGKYADFETISRLITKYKDNTAASVDTDIQQVYARLAVLANKISSSSNSLATELDINKEDLYKLLSNTEAIRNLSIKTSIKESSHISSTKATFIADITTKISDYPRLLSNFVNRVESEIVNGIKQLTERVLNKIDTTEVSDTFLHTVINEFNSRKSRHIERNEVLTSQGEPEKIISTRLEALLESTSTEFKSLDSIVKHKKPRVKKLEESPIALIPLINNALEEELKRLMKKPKLEWGGGYGKSYGTTKTGKILSAEPKGRFARNVKVVDISANKLNRIDIAKFTFQREFYQTFLAGGAKWTSQRDIEKLLTIAIRNIALDKVSSKFKAQAI